MSSVVLLKALLIEFSCAVIYLEGIHSKHLTRYLSKWTTFDHIAYFSSMFALIQHQLSEFLTANIATVFFINSLLDITLIFYISRRRRRHDVASVVALFSLESEYNLRPMKYVNVCFSLRDAVKMLSQQLWCSV